MKIGILIHSFLPLEYGGVEIGTYQLAEELAKNHQIIILTRHKAPLALNERISNFFIIRIKVIDLPILRFFTFIISLLIQIRQLKNIDVVQSQMIEYSSLSAILSKILFGIPCIVWGKGSDVYQAERKNVFSRIIFKFIVSHANFVLALDENMKKEIIRLSKREDVYIVPEGINLKKFHRKKTYNDEKINLMFIGRLHKIKGVRYLLQAIPMIKERIKNIKLTIVGEGEEEKRLKNFSQMLINSNKINHSEIEFVGSVPHEKIPEYLQMADILILPSLSEGLPVVILEAMAMGVPVVATNVGGVPLIVKNGENGIIVAPKNSRELALAVIDILTVHNITRMRAMAIEHAKKYDLRVIAQQIEKIYELSKT